MNCKKCGDKLQDKQKICLVIDEEKKWYKSEGCRIVMVFALLYLIVALVSTSIAILATKEKPSAITKSSSTTDRATPTNKPVATEAAQTNQPTDSASAQTRKAMATKTTEIIRYYSGSANVPDFGHMFGVEEMSRDSMAEDAIKLGVVNYKEGREYISQYTNYLVQKGFIYMGEVDAGADGVIGNGYCNDVVYINVFSDGNGVVIQWMDVFAAKKKYKGYTEHPTVPEYGELFGKKHDLFEKMENNITVYGYSNESSKNYKAYLEVLLQAGFVLTTEPEVSNDFCSATYERGTRRVNVFFVTSSNALLISVIKAPFGN